MKLFDLSGKTAIVTGCNKGLGYGMAIALAEAGADIVAVNRTVNHELKKAIEAQERRFVAISADLTAITDVNSIIDAAVAAFGHIDILVNNAGAIRRCDSMDFTEKDWDDVMNVNLKTVFFLSQAFAKQVIEQKTKGKIINIASMLSFQGGIRVPSYTASKSGVMGITKALANEWASFGININAIAPGYMATDNTAQLRADEAREREILSRIPAGRWGTPEDLAGATIFLAAEASDYVNGTTIAVDGGWLAR